jgi:hypothetical protein
MDSLVDLYATDEFDYFCLLPGNHACTLNPKNTISQKSHHQQYQPQQSNDTSDCSDIGDSSDDSDTSDSDDDCDGDGDGDGDGTGIVASMLTPSDTEELFEEACTLADDYIRENVGKMSHPDFHDAVIAYVFDQLRIALFASIGEMHPVDSDEVRSYILQLVERSLEYVFTAMNNVDPEKFPPWRSQTPAEVVEVAHLVHPANERELARIQARITELQNMQDQTEQRTPAWYERRHNLITASAAWKAFGTDAVMNQLIYEKCKPFMHDMGGDDQMVNVDSPLHWGQKYEQLSAAIYQIKNNTRLGEFGCIQHSNPTLSFLGGSPDGINVDPASPLFGRMVEIKNIVNREITGIPKEEYWIQMQIQMEVCDLEACDFVETRFKEYENAEDYAQDVELDYQYRTAEYRAGDENDLEDDDMQRGIIIYFIEKSTRKPHYEYMPVHYRDTETQDAWVVNTICQMETVGQGYIWIRNIYWRLDQYSCVLVRRNRLWFNEYAAPQFQCIWRTIETERVSGYAHRAPKKRGAAAAAAAAAAQDNNSNSSGGTSSSSSGGYQTQLCRIVL